MHLPTEDPEYLGNYQKAAASTPSFDRRCLVVHLSLIIFHVRGRNSKSAGKVNQMNDFNYMNFLHKFLADDKLSAN